MCGAGCGAHRFAYGLQYCTAATADGRMCAPLKRGTRSKMLTHTGFSNRDDRGRTPLKGRLEGMPTGAGKGNLTDRTPEGGPADGPFGVRSGTIFGPGRGRREPPKTYFHKKNALQHKKTAEIFW